MYDATDTATPNCPERGIALEQAYERLRKLAARLMRNERVGHSLSPTDLVHEALARLLSGDSQDPSTRISMEMFRQAAAAMNHVLIDHGRRRAAAKRGGGGGAGARRLNLNDLEASLGAPTRDWSNLSEALEQMRQRDPRRHAVVVMRFFGGLNNRQIAQELNIDERTVGRDWAASKLWLRQQLKADGTGDDA